MTTEWTNRSVAVAALEIQNRIANF